MEIRAIILYYKKFEESVLCLRSFFVQKLPSEYTLTATIVDNNSQDGRFTELAALFPQIDIIKNSSNLGFARAVNQAIQAAQKDTVDYFLLLNDDAYLEPNCLAELIEASQGKNISGPAIFYKENKNLLWQGGGYFDKKKMGIRMPGKNSPLQEKEKRVTEFLSGCVLLIPKYAIEKIGLLDTEFFFYGEDLDFCLRAKQHNISIIYCPAASATHDISIKSGKRADAFSLYHLARSYFLIIKKHFPEKIFFASLLFIFVYSPFRLYQIIFSGGGIKEFTAWLKGAWSILLKI